MGGSRQRSSTALISAYDLTNDTIAIHGRGRWHPPLVRY